MEELVSHHLDTLPFDHKNIYLIQTNQFFTKCFELTSSSSNQLLIPAARSLFDWIAMASLISFM